MCLTILTDLDGTLLPRPVGVGSAVVHPSLSDGPCHKPLVELLDLGCTIVGVTGSRLATHQTRFFEDLPLEHRRAGRVLLGVQTGSFLYKGSPADGSPVEDLSFAESLEKQNVRLTTDPSIVDGLIEVGRAGIRKFFADLARDRSLVEVDSPLGYLLDCSADEIPVTNDNHFVPRIEVREGNSAVVFVGVPSTLGADYFAVPEAAVPFVDGRPCGRACFDCVPRGVDKSLVVTHLLGADLLQPGRVVALGDQPAGNDEGLARWHRSSVCDIPFVSVSERVDMVPSHLRDCHVTAASNAEGSALVLAALAAVVREAKARGAAAGGEHTLLTMSTPALRGLIDQLNSAATA